MAWDGSFFPSRRGLCAPSTPPHIVEALVQQCVQQCARMQTRLIWLDDSSAMAHARECGRHAGRQLLPCSLALTQHAARRTPHHIRQTSDGWLGFLFFPHQDGSSRGPRSPLRSTPHTTSLTCCQSHALPPTWGNDPLNFRHYVPCCLPYLI